MAMRPARFFFVGSGSQHQRLSSPVERNQLEHPRPDFSPSSIIALNTAHRFDHVSRLPLKRERDRCNINNARGFSTFRQSYIDFLILGQMFGERRRKRENYYSDREIKFLSIITSLIRIAHSKSSRSSFPSDESNYHLARNAKGFRSEATSGRRPNAAKSSAI